jgi:NADH:ubiquinone oxidoreductase subunit F (NADH-binding)/(2Fe-2S) ferredoxin/NAD-dependent dihydropyrimidine dehydrogenase PreA subunit
VTLESLQQQAAQTWAQFTRPDCRRVLIGAATCGRAAGALRVAEAFRNEFDRRGLRFDSGTADALASPSMDRVLLAEVGCLGLCYAEPLVEVQSGDGTSILYQRVTPQLVPKLVETHLLGGRPLSHNALAVMAGEPILGIPRFDELPMIRQQVRIILRNCGVIDPTQIEHAMARGAYRGLERALELGREAVIAEVTASGLRGRGGAGFSTGTKWSFAARAAGDEKYVICNADEGDPGAFMNRSVLESDPHSVLEGLTISGWAVGARTGYIYVRAEYPLAIERLRSALEQMRASGLSGGNILGSGFDFDIHIKKGAGAFVCGEETALIAAIEGRRGMPRPRPPFPAVSGLFGKPTCINNVETLAAVSAILDNGAVWYTQFGTEKSRGTKTFSLAGKIERTGLIEVTLGTPLRTIVEEIGGGVLDGKGFKAVQTGGPSGGCIPAHLLDLQVDYEHLAEAGSIMGSGGMVVMDEDSCMVDVARYFLTFTESESCGKCVPCRMGTQHLLRILTGLTEGAGAPGDLAQLHRLSEAMRKASLCGLGQTAPNPVLTTLQYFAEEYREHIEDHRCSAGVCRELVEFWIDAEKCNGCTACVRSCPVDSIAGEKKQPHLIDAGQCIRCGACRATCKFGAVLVRPRSIAQNGNFKFSQTVTHHV